MERILKLLLNLGVRARQELREYVAATRQALREHVAASRERIEILMDAQMRNEARFAQNEERFARLTEAHIKLAESQAHTDQRLDALIDIVRNGRR